MKSSASATSEVEVDPGAPAAAQAAAQASVVRAGASAVARRKPVAHRLAVLLAALWAGLLVTISAVATPVPFAVLDTPSAGRVVSVIFLIEAYASVVFSVVLFSIERGQARRAAEAGRGSILSTNMLLVLGALFCTVLGYFAVTPMMAQARMGQGAWSFAALHMASTGLFGLKTLLVMVLAWRASAR